MHVTYTPEVQISVRFTLRWAVLELRPNFRKSAQNDLDMFKAKNTKMHVTPPRPKFSSVSLYDEPFLGYSPILEKGHRMTPNDLDMFKVKNTNMHVTYTPEAQIFVRFTLRWAIFKEIETFEFPILQCKNLIISNS